MIKCWNLLCAVLNSLTPRPIPRLLNSFACDRHYTDWWNCSSKPNLASRKTLIIIKYRSKNPNQPAQKEPLSLLSSLVAFAPLSLFPNPPLRLCNSSFSSPQARRLNSSSTSKLSLRSLLNFGTSAVISHQLGETQRRIFPFPILIHLVFC